MSDLTDHPKRRVGGWGFVVILAFVAGALIYFTVFIAKGGDAEGVRFRDDCWDRSTRIFGSDTIPEQVRKDIVRHCEQALRKWRHEKTD